MTSKSKIILGLMAAAAAGAAMGVLMAPGKGSKLRKKIITKSAGALHNLYNLLSVNGRDKAYASTAREEPI